jgi:hypothetical protein
MKTFRSKQEWSPDTCGCTFEQTFEYEDDPQRTKPGVFVEHRLVTRCAHHAPHSEEGVAGENYVKNVALTLLTQEHVGADGKPVLDVTEHDWHMDAARTIHIIPHPDMPADKVDAFAAKWEALTSHPLEKPWPSVWLGHKVSVARV